MNGEQIKVRAITIRIAKNRKKNKKSGASRDDLYIPTCACFKDADGFLRKIVSISPVFENLANKELNALMPFCVDLVSE